MKPFNLEEAKAGKPICTRDGRKARLLAWDIKDKVYPLCAALFHNWGEETVQSFMSDGRYSDSQKKHYLDLFMYEEEPELTRTQARDNAANAFCRSICQDYVCAPFLNGSAKAQGCDRLHLFLKTYDNE